MLALRTSNMTTHRYKRCGHCQVKYTYQASGHGCNNPHNDETYCPTCKARALEALRQIPVRFECRYFPVAEVPQFADVTRQHIEEWEADLEERRKTQIVAQRIWPALMNLQTGDSQSIRLVVASRGPHIGTGFRVSSWKQNPEYLIEIGLEWDIQSQQTIGVWR